MSVIAGSLSKKKFFRIQKLQMVSFKVFKPADYTLYVLVSRVPLSNRRIVEKSRKGARFVLNPAKLPRSDIHRKPPCGIMLSNYHTERKSSCPVRGYGLILSGLIRRSVYDICDDLR